MSQTNEAEFLVPRFVGARFDGGVIPLEVLADFAGLSELLIETAKWKFLQANAGRKRSPRGFTKGIELKLTEIREGSAIPVIALTIAATAASLFAPESAKYLPQARDAIVEAIDAAATKQPITLPEHLLAYFDRLGRNLAENEAIEFPTSTPGKSARLDKPTRRALLLASSTIDKLTDVTHVRGVISEADQGRKTFEIELSDGRKVVGPLTTQHRAQLMEAFNAYTNRQRVQMDCIGQFDRSNRLIGIESIEQVTLLDPLDISARLDELRNLRAGWLEGGGAALSAEGLSNLERSFDSYFPDNIAPPHLYPTPEGKISAEWSLSPYEISMNIDLAQLAGDLHSLNIDDDTESSLHLNLTQEADWKILVDFITKLPGGRL